MPDKLLTPAEVADLLRLDIRTIYRLVKDDELAPVYRIGHRTIRIPQATLDAYLDGREQTPCK